MGKRPFGATAARWITQLGATGAVIHDHRAQLCTRQPVIADLSGGADVVIYLGHGRPRGWSGYQTIRNHHLDAAARPNRPTDAVLAFACNTLARPGPDPAFGEHLVATGLTRAYLGWNTAIPFEPGLRLADRFITLLATTPDHTVGSLLDAVTDSVRDEHERPLLDGCRIVGDPTATLLARLTPPATQPSDDATTRSTSLSPAEQPNRAPDCQTPAKITGSRPPQPSTHPLTAQHTSSDKVHSRSASTGGAPGDLTGS